MEKSTSINPEPEIRSSPSHVADPRHYAKFIAAVIGAGATAAIGIISPDDPVFIWLTVVAAMCTAVTVYFVPNRQA